MGEGADAPRYMKRNMRSENNFLSNFNIVRTFYMALESIITSFKADEETVSPEQCVSWPNMGNV